MPTTRSVRSFASHNNTGNRPPSPTLSATTTHASADFPYRPDVLVTRADLRASVQAYEHLLQTCKAYTNAMLVVSRASADFAGALEECSRLKGAHEQADKLQACSGLHYLMSNYSQVLADSFWKDFQCPLLESFDTYRNACNERQLLHEKQILEKSKLLKETEAKNMRMGSSKRKGDPGRDLNSFRRALAELQRQVDDLDQLKGEYYQEVLHAEQENWDFIQSKVSLLVRSQVEISDRISSKGLSDPVLEPLLASIPDPFGSYGPPKGQDLQIISILQPSTNAIGSAAQSPALRGSEEEADGHGCRAGPSQNQNGAADDGEGHLRRSHSLFGTVNYMDGDNDDHFLSTNAAAWATPGTEGQAKAPTLPEDMETPTKASNSRPDPREHKRTSSSASTVGAASERDRHALSVIIEAQNPDTKDDRRESTEEQAVLQDKMHAEWASRSRKSTASKDTIPSAHSADGSAAEAATNALISADVSNSGASEPEQDDT